MKKLTFKTEKVLAAYRLLGSAKYGKLADEDKIKVLKICIALKPSATKYDEDSKDVAEKLKPSEDYDERLAQAQEYERVSRDKDADASQLKMGPAEFNEFVKGKLATLANLINCLSIQHSKCSGCRKKNTHRI